MHNVVIVDDEMIVSRGLSEKIDWGQLECSIVGIGSNGMEGKELVDRHRPDIVITDIKMPGMNGLDLAQYVKENYPEIVTILLSGYTEFDYARTAVRHQVFDYLLKPVDLEDLKKCVRKAKKHLASIGTSARKAELDQEASERKTALAETGISAVRRMTITTSGRRFSATKDRTLPSSNTIPKSSPAYSNAG